MNYTCPKCESLVSWEATKDADADLLFKLSLLNIRCVCHKDNFVPLDCIKRHELIFNVQSYGRFPKQTASQVDTTTESGHQGRNGIAMISMTPRRPNIEPYYPLAESRSALASGTRSSQISPKAVALGVLAVSFFMGVIYWVQYAFLRPKDTIVYPG